jgi:hypothetical protein
MEAITGCPVQFQAYEPVDGLRSRAAEMKGTRRLNHRIIQFSINLARFLLHPAIVALKALPDRVVVGDAATAPHT